MNKIAIVVGSTRPNRKGREIAEWVYTQGKKRHDAVFELVDINDYHLPLLDEGTPPIMGDYTHNHTKIWSQKINEFDGYIFVTPEYNKATSGALKNALDYLFSEWNNKACGFVGYGLFGGTSAVENLRQITGELMMADVRDQVRISLFNDYVNQIEFKPADFQLDALNRMFSQLISWSDALSKLRK